MRLQLLLSVYIGLIAVILGELIPNKDNVSEIILSKGYPCETHQIQTQDGYLLTVHRIPYGLAPDAGQATGKPVVFLMHGLFSSSADYIATGPDNDAAGFYFSNQGYDVWMGNARGNTWSRKHISLSPDNILTRQKFWNFSFHEISIFDVPAMIDYTLNVTKQTKLHYIGHSQGATNLFVMLSMLPKYNDVIDTAHAVSPLAYFGHTKSPLFRAFLQLQSIFGDLSNYIGLDEFEPRNDIYKIPGYSTCLETSSYPEICSNILFLNAGYDNDQLNATVLPTILSNSPAGTSIKLLVHYVQLIKSREFWQFNRGPVGNLRAYGALRPPKYPVHKIKTRINVYYGQNDWIVNLKDAHKIIKNLGNVVSHPISYPTFNNVDFIWAKDVKSLLYDDIIKIMNMNNK